MLRKRIIVCLDVDGGRVVKGTRFLDLRDMGDPVELADRYQQQGADEIAFLDISASNEARGTVLDVVRSAGRTPARAPDRGRRSAHGRRHRQAAALRCRQGGDQLRRSNATVAAH